ncbi:MAG: hypothetical protein AB7N76_16750 [Planctomycetota bacterium]
MRSLLLCLPLLLSALCCAARADVVHLRNGRTIEGEVTKETAKFAEVMTAGGKLKVPRGMIQKIERRESARAAFTKKRAELDMNDAKAVEELSRWASENGLGKESIDLAARARDLRLEAKVAAARAKDSAEGFIATFHWARRSGVGRSIQLWLLEEAHKRDKDHPELKTAFQQLKRDVEDEEERIKRTEEIMSRPRYVNPVGEQASGSTYAQTVALKARVASRDAERKRLGDERAELQKIKVSIARVSPDDPVEEARRKQARYKD